MGLNRGLIALALGGLIAATGADAARRPRDEGVEFNAALARCLRATPARPPRPTGRVATAPGIDGSVRAWRLAAANGPAISYVGTDAKILRCGVALYGPVTHESLQKAMGLIGKVQRLKRQSPDTYPPFPGEPAADRIYWGDPLGPTSRGVLLVLRKASPGLPTLEIESHARQAW